MGPQMGGPVGPVMNPQMRPQMGHQMGAQKGPQIGTQMGLQIGAFPSNVQLGHQFPKQQQIRIDQQRKQAEENMKKQEELMKKKQLEAKQRKLQQSFSAKKATSTDALDSLFGKNKKGGGSSMTDLIGPLGKETTPKSTATKPTSICKYMINVKSFFTPMLQIIENSHLHLNLAILNLIISNSLLSYAQIIFPWVCFFSHLL